MRSPLDLEHNHQENKLGKCSRKYTHKGYISAQFWGRKRWRKHVLNTYMSWKMIKMMLEHNFPWSRLWICSRTWSIWRRELRAQNVFFSPWVRPRFWGGRRRVLACSYSLNLEDIMIGKYFRDVLKYCKYGVCGALLEKIQGERERERRPTVGEGGRGIWVLTCMMQHDVQIFFVY